MLNNKSTIFVGTAVYQLAKNFITAMYYWAKSGFKVVSYRTFWQRRYTCHVCSQGIVHRCPTCGCFLWAICHISSSKCSNWDKFKDETYLASYEIIPTEK